MDIIFMNSKNSGTSNPLRLLVNLTNKINLKKVINMLLYQILAFTIYTWKNTKKGHKKINLK